MSKNLSIIAILAIFMLVGTIPVVLGDNTMKVASSSSGPSVQQASTAFSQKITASTLATPVSTANLAKNLDKWYYGKVNDVVISDDTTLDLKYKSGKTFVTQTFTIKPASTSCSVR